MSLKGKDAQRLTGRGTNRDRTEDETLRFGEQMLMFNIGSGDVRVVIWFKGEDQFANDTQRRDQWSIFVLEWTSILSICLPNLTQLFRNNKIINYFHDRDKPYFE